MRTDAETAETDEPPLDPARHVAWTAAFVERARAYWTPARVHELAGDKDLLLPPVEAAPLLRALGLLHRDASMPPKQVRKYWQVSHMVRLLEPALPRPDGTSSLRVLDLGCGRSYLSLVLAWCGQHRWQQRIEVLGIDHNAALIAECERRTGIAGLEARVRFEASALAATDVAAAWQRRFDDDGAPQVVLALHACDTATCDAIAIGVATGAALIAVAPCCQAELARGWAALHDRGVPGSFAPIWGEPHLRRETAADLTDAMRLQLLRSVGYEARAIEFVPSQHTRKNTLLRAQRTTTSDAAAAWQAYAALRDDTGGVGITLAHRLDALGLLPG